MNSLCPVNPAPRTSSKPSVAAFVDAWAANADFAGIEMKIPVPGRRRAARTHLLCKMAGPARSGPIARSHGRLEQTFMPLEGSPLEDSRKAALALVTFRVGTGRQTIPHSGACSQRAERSSPCSIDRNRFFS